MAKITYSSLKLKLNTDFNKIADTNIEVLKYLPIEDKSDLINITLQQSLEKGVINQAKLDAFFHIYLVMMYSNITFTDKQKENPLQLYDILKSNGLLDKIIMAIDESEYQEMLDYLNRQEIEESNYRKSFNGIIDNILNKLTTDAESLNNIIDNFDPSKYQTLINFAKAANGGRPIE